jgi:hypothetical protein
MKRLSRKLATQLTHEVACWLEYERFTGGFRYLFRYKNGFPFAWHVGPFLEGACAIAATILAHVLKARGYAAATIRLAGHHYFVRTKSGMRLDPTWGQFRGRPPRVDMSRKLKNEQRVSFEDMLRVEEGCEANLYHPCWPRHHLAAMNRIFRRMGVESLDVAA